VDVEAADRLGITVARVAAYSPYAVAEFAVGLMLALNRKIHRAYNRVREGNFLLDGLLGFDLHGRTVGVVGTGRIGTVTAGILQGFGCRVLACDPLVNDALVKSGVSYVDFNMLLASADIVTLHVPLTAKSRHMMDARAIEAMRPGAMLINTSRGGLVETGALIAALKSGHLGAVGLDVYEEEEQLYYRDLSESIITDDLFMRLVTFHNVIITGHQAFFTHEALTMIAQTTVRNLDNYAAGRRDDNVVTQTVSGE
jgi:D-lactate dehydrogenase